MRTRDDGYRGGDGLDAPVRSVLDAELYAGDPHPTYTWYRRHSPMHWDEAHQLWVLSKYADVVYVSKHPELFCSGKGVRPNSSQLISIVTMDEPRHGQLRQLVNRGFTPRMVAALEPRIATIAKESVDAIAPHGRCDFVRDIAIDLPIMMIAEMLGIRPEDRSRFHRWSDTMIAAGVDNPAPEVQAGAVEAFREFAAYLTEIFDDRRRAPRDDLVSVLLDAQEQGILAADAETISNDELLMFMTLLLVAGNETTRNALSGGVIALIQNPEQRAKLVRRPELMPLAVEEIVRWVSPVINFTRTVTRDTELRGTPLRAGDHVLLLYPSANRDEDQFEDAGRFKVDREPNEHIGFGIGNHFCLGANLARLELRIMLSELLRRIPDFEFAADAAPVYASSSFVRGVTAMPLVFTPASVAALRPEARAYPRLAE
jgi:cytochrome P450 family 142 subfamily A polypeptide 1